LAVGGRGFVAGRRRIRESAFQRIASVYVAFQVDVDRVIVGREAGSHIMNSTT
jgi:hypothetical protein